MFGAALKDERIFLKGQEVAHTVTNTVGVVQTDTVVKGQYDRVPVRFENMFDGATVPVAQFVLREATGPKRR